MKDLEQLNLVSSIKAVIQMQRKAFRNSNSILLIMYWEIQQLLKIFGTALTNHLQQFLMVASHVKTLEDNDYIKV